MNKRLLYLVLITVVSIITYKVISFFSTFHFYAAGTYPYAETYYLKYPEEKIIKALKNLKLTNLNTLDKDTSDYWHDIYFDFENSKLQTWTRKEGNETLFALIAVYKNKQWNYVNQDLGLYGNIKLKREFEREIIEKLKIELEK